MHVYKSMAMQFISESDIDECADSNGGCQHNCTNTIGSYHCSCAAGHDLNDDHHSCSRAG